MTSIAEEISRELLSWPGVTVQPHRFGGLEFRLNGHELGHLHSNRQADLPFSVKTREELVAAGKADHLSDVLPMAAESIDSGMAEKKLEALIKFTNAAV